MGKAFGLYHPKDDTEHGREFGGYPVIGSPIAIAHTEQNFYMWGKTQRSNQLTSRGFGTFGALYEITDLRKAKPIGEPKYSAEEGESHAYSLCYDGEYLYMSGADTQSLYIIDPKTADLYLIGKWQFTKMPEGFSEHPTGGILNMTDPEYPQGIIGQIYITGITFDGTDMFAVESFTNGLYKLEKR